MDSGLLTETKFILKSLVRSCPRAVTIDDLNKDYIKTMGYPIPFRKLGFRNLDQFLHSIPDTILLSSGRRPFVYVPQSEKTLHIDKMSNVGKNVRNPVAVNRRRYTPPRLRDTSNMLPIKSITNWRRKNNIEIIKKNEPIREYNNNIYKNGPNYAPTETNKCNGTPISNGLHFVDKLVPDSNKTDTNRANTDQINKANNDNINKTNTSIYNEKTYFNKYVAMPATGTNNINRANTDLINNNKTHTDINNEETDVNRYVAVPNIHYDDALFLIDFPSNTVKFGHKIKPFELPENLKDGDIFSLFITEIHNPYKFWFHVAKENDELDDMMTNLQDFYEHSNEDLEMKLSNIIPGQICAAPYSGIWHRAEILEIKNNIRVKVCFIDYGTVSYVQKNKVKYLPIGFAKLNKQALRGCLSHIRPSGLRWSRDTTYSFLDMVADKLLYGKVIQILQDEKIVQLILTDTNQEKDFVINNALILRGHAKINNDINLKIHDQFSYPTFEMLEKGEYPSFYDLGLLLAKGVDYEEKVYNNLICDVFANKCSLEEYIQKLTSYHIRRTN